jgi:hypothetical protein
MVVFTLLQPYNGAAILAFHEAVQKSLQDGEQKGRLAKYWTVSTLLLPSHKAPQAQAHRDGLSGDNAKAI